MHSLLPSADPAPTRVLVVDGHELFRRGLLIVLAQEPDIEVVAQAEDAASALSLAARHSPDLALLAADLRDDVASLCAALIAVAPAMRLLLLTNGAHAAVAVPGVVGFLAKESSIDEVITAIRTAVDTHPVRTAVDTRPFRPVIVEHS